MTRLIPAELRVRGLRCLSAANESNAFQQGQQGQIETATAGRTSGWDPYEVWRTRVKPVQRQERSEPAS